MFNIDSPYILKLHQAFYKEKNCILIFEFMNCGSLGDVIKITKSIPESALCKITEQILNGLIILEQSNIIHRDIKPENILINSNGSVKIGDFGMSSKKEGKCWETYKGTLCYMSLERLKGEKHEFSSDIWSLGMTLLSCYLGRFPIDLKENTEWEVMEKIKKIDLKNYDISNEFRDFLSNCLFVDPLLRSNASKLLSHEWINKVKSTSLKHWIYEKYILPRKAMEK